MTAARAAGGVMRTGRPIIINGGRRFNLASQRKLVIRSKSWSVTRGESLKASSDRKI